MKLGRWGWSLKRLSLARFQRNRGMGIGQSAKKWVAESFFFCDVNHAPLLPLSLDLFPPNFPRTRVQVLARDTSFHIPLRDRICRKTLFLGVPCLCSAYGSRETFCDAYTVFPKFPSDSGHPTDDSFLGDFCWGMYRFPPIHLPKWPFATVSAMGIPGWGHSLAIWQ